jgi:hypothetical protein
MSKLRVRVDAPAQPRHLPRLPAFHGAHEQLGRCAGGRDVGDVPPVGRVLRLVRLEERDVAHAHVERLRESPGGGNRPEVGAAERAADHDLLAAGDPLDHAAHHGARRGDLLHGEDAPRGRGLGGEYGDEHGGKCRQQGEGERGGTQRHGRSPGGGPPAGWRGVADRGGGAPTWRAAQRLRRGRRSGGVAARGQPRPARGRGGRVTWPATRPTDP